MLARKAIPRRLTLSKLSWRSAQTAHLSSIPRPDSQHLRPQGLWGKFRYRKDGQPRSRLAGTAFGSLILVNALTLSAMSGHMDDSELALGLLASIIYIQQADRSFILVDLQNPLATLNFFKKLYQAFSRDSPEDVDDLFKDLTRLMKSDNAEGEAHNIMRTAAEQVHAAFQNLNDDSISNTANYVLSVMRDALERLTGLVEDCEDDSDTKYTFQLIRDRSKKDSGSVLKDYESLG